MDDLVLTREQVRQVDRRAIERWGINSLVLMENAGRGATDLILAAKLPPPIVICCGKGNNGGDGLVIARHLAIHGVEAKVLIWNRPEEFSNDARANYEILTRCNVPILDLTDDPVGALFSEAIASAGTIVDALLGTGATGDPRPPANVIIAKLNAAERKRVAIDIPSGLDCDTGKPGEPTFQADLTITFVARKPGLIADGAQSYVGDIRVADIGLPRVLVESVA